MSGIAFWGRDAGTQPVDVRSDNYLASASLTGSTALYVGDIIAGTRNTTLAGNPAVGTCVRRLLAADITANYLQGGLAVGVLGICNDGYVTDSSGRVTGSVYSGNPPNNVFLQAPNEAAATRPAQVSGRSRLNITLATPGSLFVGRINVNTTDFASGLTLGDQYNNTRCGLKITADGNESIYTLYIGAATADQVVQIVQPVFPDQRYGTLITGTDTAANNALADAKSGPYVVFRFLTDYSQASNGRAYTSQ